MNLYYLLKKLRLTGQPASALCTPLSSCRKTPDFIIWRWLVFYLFKNATYDS